MCEHYDRQHREEHHEELGQASQLREVVDVGRALGTEHLQVPAEGLERSRVIDARREADLRVALGLREVDPVDITRRHDEAAAELTLGEVESRADPDDGQHHRVSLGLRNTTRSPKPFPSERASRAPSNTSPDPRGRLPSSTVQPSSWRPT